MTVRQILSSPPCLWTTGHDREGRATFDVLAVIPVLANTISTGSVIATCKVKLIIDDALESFDADFL